MSNNLGMGVMLGMLGGSDETLNAIKLAKGQIISRAEVSDNTLRIWMQNGSQIAIWDGGQSCCEHRYMVCDDKLEEFHGAEILDFLIKSTPGIERDYGDHEIQFLEVSTDRGAITCANHNEHNGYYGGFWMKASLTIPFDNDPDDPK